MQYKHLGTHCPAQLNQSRRQGGSEAVDARMEKNPYTMAKLGLEPRENLRSNRDCSFYVKYFFFFLSIIQFLIILGLVLFMIYGNTQAGTDDHMKRLSARVENCNVDIGNLKKEKEALKRQLNTSQVEARGLRATLNRYNSSLKACNDEKVSAGVWRERSHMTRDGLGELGQVQAGSQRQDDCLWVVRKDPFLHY